MSEKKTEELNELSEQQLDIVNGGSSDSGPDKGEHIPPEHKGAFIDKYASERYIGKMVYLVNNNNTKEYWWGTLTASYEQRKIIFWSSRMYNMFVKGMSSNYIMYEGAYSRVLLTYGNLDKIKGDCVSMFEYKP